MTPDTDTRATRTIDINHLRHGGRYEATTLTGTVVNGEYLGIEVVSDEWHILLRTVADTHSVAIGDLAEILATAA